MQIFLIIEGTHIVEVFHSWNLGNSLQLFLSCAKGYLGIVFIGLNLTIRLNGNLLSYWCKRLTLTDVRCGILKFQMLWLNNLYLLWWTSSLVVAEKEQKISILLQKDFYFLNFESILLQLHYSDTRSLFLSRDWLFLEFSFLSCLNWEVTWEQR